MIGNNFKYWSNINKNGIKNLQKNQMTANNLEIFAIKSDLYIIIVIIYK
jgi:hypothetical protein